MVQFANCKSTNTWKDNIRAYDFDLIFVFPIYVHHRHTLINHDNMAEVLVLNQFLEMKLYIYSHFVLIQWDSFLIPTPTVRDSEHSI